MAFAVETVKSIVDPAEMGLRLSSPISICLHRPLGNPTSALSGPYRCL